MRAWRTPREITSFITDIFRGAQLIACGVAIFYLGEFFIDTFAANHSGMTFLKALLRALPAKLWEAVGF